MTSDHDIGQHINRWSTTAMYISLEYWFVMFCQFQLGSSVCLTTCQTSRGSRSDESRLSRGSGALWLVGYRYYCPLWARRKWVIISLNNKDLTSAVKAARRRGGSCYFSTWSGAKRLAFQHMGRCSSSRRNPTPASFTSHFLPPPSSHHIQASFWSLE